MLYFQSLDEVLSALKRRIWLIVAITLIGCVVSVVVALLREPVYNAIAVVQIEDAQVAGTNTSAGAIAESRASLDARRTVRLIEQRVMSRGALFEIMDTHGLFNDDPAMTPIDRLTAMRESVSIEAILAGEAWQPNQSVSGMVIEVNLNDPQKAAAVANDLLGRVMAEARARSVDRAQFELEFFDTEEARIREQIAAAEAEIAEFKSASADVLPANIAVLQGELTTLNTSLLTLRQQILSLESNSSRVRPEALARQVGVLEDQIALIEARIAEINAMLARAPSVERELAALERELSRLNEQFTVIARRKADAQMSQSLEQQRQLARFEVLERAIEPVYPISRSKRSIAMLGGVASLLVAIGIAFLLEIRNPPIRNAAQMERALGVRPVITVPHLGPVRSVRGTGKDRRSKFGWGVILALLAGLLALIAKPLGELGGMNFSPRNAQ
ncbi:Wzz/FepE/Etk N-terminal domain-containing protein [Marivita sp. GX14005]|uniref:Wzz/FepE/Etk N-terminal domain-containing protein n=1 Tax=Marivita sp. GX14005 TaxID=2942276 RepID=UPI0020194EF8|nr:Wzz/FepE/Etk N-terminal domain-containing protein [Marivita sp. GX14005]MCL3881770.1 Wzz/FepE/Etk N-terminal domain-containing protein [Marivita sp. GX14005]